MKNLESSKKSENKSTLDQTCQNGPPLPQPTEGSLLHKCQRDNPVTNFFIFFKLKHNSHFYFAVISQTSGKYICVCLQVQPQMLAMLKQSAELPRKLLCKFSKHKAQTEDQPKLEKKNINGAPKGPKKKKKKKH